ncbi:hypothetical protein E3N88_31383 [Mikania micrantha]|uniref:Uncharacterized protein n=1 Tax=Mikania micrantha TaxID=192012 RepID=A0A5N6MQ47_9ASTR|nr:hypothetical protein E3N88_31383 [Mikania micrantha]
MYNIMKSIQEFEHHNGGQTKSERILAYLVKYFGHKCRCYNANTICLLCLNARNAWSALSAINFESYKLIMQKQRFGLSVLASQVAKLKSYKLVMQKQRFGLSVLASPVAKLKSYELDKLKQRFGLSVLASPTSACTLIQDVTCPICSISPEVFKHLSIIKQAPNHLWKLVEKLTMPKKAKAPAAEKQLTEGVKWSFAAGTNLLPNFGAKFERESKLRLNDFTKERSFTIVDMSGCNFGDEGPFYLAESLEYNQARFLDHALFLSALSVS